MVGLAGLVTALALAAVAWSVWFSDPDEPSSPRPAPGRAGEGAGQSSREGAEVVLRLSERVPDEVMERAAATIRERLARSGARSFSVEPVGRRLRVRFGENEDVRRLMPIVTRTAELRFRPVIGPPLSARPTRATLDEPAEEVVLPEDTEDTVQRWYRLGPAELTGEAMQSASAEFDESTGLWRVAFTLSSEGAKAFDDMAARYVGRQIAIVVDGLVVSAPAIREASFGGSGVIEGDFSEAEAKELAVLLDVGPLPVTLEAETVRPFAGEAPSRGAGG